jgi:hypothetical protein
MARDATYRILDEPSPGGLAHLSVNPFWIFLGMMLGGAWLGWPWFVLNSFAIGSATRVKELGLAALGLIGTVALAFGWLAMGKVGVIHEGNAPYAATVFIVYKLAVTYFVFLAQQRSFELHRYFGGPVRNPVLLVLLAFYLGHQVTKAVPGDFWQLVTM